MPQRWKEWKLAGSYPMDYGDAPGWYARAHFAPKATGAASWAELDAYRAREGTTAWGAGPFETDTQAYDWVRSKRLEVDAVEMLTQQQVDDQKAWLKKHEAAFQRDIDSLKKWEADHKDGDRTA